MTIPHEPTKAALAAGAQALRDCGMVGTGASLRAAADSVWRAMAAEMNGRERDKLFDKEVVWVEDPNGPATDAT